ncbi:MAG: DUF2851 family protein [Victivallaceae bacterium]
MNRSKDERFSEKSLQFLWNSIDTGKKYSLEDNRSLEIISPGTWNGEAGPDFSNARIRIDGISCTGAVEIHLKASDWFAHGHQHDRNYNQVILHVVAENDLDQNRREQLPPMLVIKKSAVTAGFRKLNYGDCSAFFKNAGNEKIKRLLTEAGLHRFNLKKNQLIRQMLLDGAEKNCLRQIFDAAGYKKNRKEFLELFERYMEYPVDLRQKHYEAILWGESGLLPDLAVSKLSEEMEEFARRLWEEWWQIRPAGKESIKWKNSGGRPVNSPCRRIVLLCRLLEFFGEKPLARLVEILNVPTPAIIAGKILKTVQFSDPLWNKYSSFTTKNTRPAAIGGKSTAVEIAVNVLLPSLAASAEIGFWNDKSPAIKSSAVKIWLELPAMQENIIIKNALSRWFENPETGRKLLNTAAAGQGVIHLYREFCEKCQADCNSCRLGNSLT